MKALMSYLALARKWRPRTFSQLVGQTHVSKGLINSLNQQRLHHAYLFTGTRGVGKTSIARLLAKALNCEQGISAEPCLNCENCRAIEQGSCIDLIEVDAASRTGVEDTRALLDNIQYAATSARFKIYLIDEVHMLSQHSFNALLKTLEEPPLHVKFLLATTDPQKLPATVLSRCLQFHLRHLSVELISKHLAYILKEEKIAYEAEALTLLAQAAKGSMRDGLSILDQVIASCDGKILTQELKHLLGYTQQDYALQILQALAEQNAKQLLDLSRQIAMEGSHFNHVLEEIIQYLHQIAIYQTLPELQTETVFTGEITQLASLFSAEDIQLFYQIAIKGSEEVHLAPTLAIGFDMTILRMLTFRPAPTAKQPPLAWEMKNNMENNMLKPSASLDKEEKLNNDSINTEEKVSLPEPALKAGEEEHWTVILPKLKLRGLTLNAAENMELLHKESGRIHFRVTKGHLSLFTPAVIQRIETSLTDYYRQTIKIKLCSEGLVNDSPAQQKQRHKEENLKLAEQALNDDPIFQQIQEDFSAKIIKNSIEPLQDDL
ncbi:DNA polymerase-3 subunit gamma/tau [Legionella israelensis DSM 19235]|nr:DNA polymerase-3 subunit gamma/tau [Legionella israelensis DSM 19235]